MENLDEEYIQNRLPICMFCNSKENYKLEKCEYITSIRRTSISENTRCPFQAEFPGHMRYRCECLTPSNAPSHTIQHPCPICLERGILRFTTVYRNMFSELKSHLSYHERQKPKSTSSSSTTSKENAKSNQSGEGSIQAQNDAVDALLSLSKKPKFNMCCRCNSEI